MMGHCGPEQVTCEWTCHSGHPWITCAGREKPATAWAGRAACLGAVRVCPPCARACAQPPRLLSSQAREPQRCGHFWRLAERKLCRPLVCLPLGGIQVRFSVLPQRTLNTVTSPLRESCSSTSHASFSALVLLSQLLIGQVHCFSHAKMRPFWQSFKDCERQWGKILGPGVLRAPSNHTPLEF